MEGAGQVVARERRSGQLRTKQVCLVKLRTAEPARVLPVLTSAAEATGCEVAVGVHDVDPLSWGATSAGRGALISREEC